MVRVRIAPSPTGIPHIGNTRTALFNYLFAKHSKGSFILRIEDTDRARTVEGAREAIIEILTWLELLPDETHMQSERLTIYRDYAEQLKEKGVAYNDEGAVRFRMPKEGETTWDDLIGQKTISFQNSTQEDFVILKSDGFPTYNFANVVDDHLMRITHVIRGEEFISSTPKHIRLYEAFGWERPSFAHLPVILGPDRTKLSKRHGAEPVLYYRDQGYLKEALLNYMALLGWNPGGDRELMSLLEMIDLFDLKDVNTANPIFDVKKLEWMNGMYIRKAQSAELKTQILEVTPKLAQIDQILLEKLLKLAQSRMKTLRDFEAFVLPILEETKITLSQDEKNIAEGLIDFLSATKQWNNEAILQILRDVTTRYNVRMGVLYKIFTGKESGLPLPETLEILGKEKIVKRLRVNSL